VIAETHPPVTPDRLLRAGRGFMESRILLTAVELGVFDHLAAHPRAAPDLAAALGTDPQATEVLLTALTALGWLTHDDRGFQVAEAGMDPDGLEAPLRHLATLWGRWSGLTHVVRHGYPPVTEPSVAAREAMALAMRWYARETAPRLAALLDGAPLGSMVDLGGGPGAYSIAMAQRFPALKVVLCDRDDQALRLAARDIRSAGLQDRILVWPRDVLVEDFGRDYDLALLSSFISTRAEWENRALLGKVREALRPGGRVVIRDYLPGEAEPTPAAAVFSVCMLVATARGRVYPRAQVKGWLEDAGFDGVHWLPMDDQQVMIARRGHD
jgi:predicted O-methyltransferase YrrM